MIIKVVEIYIEWKIKIKEREYDSEILNISSIFQLADLAFQLFRNIYNLIKSPKHYPRLTIISYLNNPRARSYHFLSIIRCFSTPSLQTTMAFQQQLVRGKLNFHEGTRSLFLPQSTEQRGSRWKVGGWNFHEGSFPQFCPRLRASLPTRGHGR